MCPDVSYCYTTVKFRAGLHVQTQFICLQLSRVRNIMFRRLLMWFISGSWFNILDRWFSCLYGSTLVLSFVDLLQLTVRCEPKLTFTNFVLDGVLSHLCLYHIFLYVNDIYFRCTNIILTFERNTVILTISKENYLNQGRFKN